MFFRPGQILRLAACVIALTPAVMAAPRETSALRIADVQYQPTPHTAADDCALFVLAGKKLLGWGANAPKYSLSFMERGDTGGKFFATVCPWKNLGITPPTVRNAEFPFDARPLSRIQPPHPPTMPGVNSLMSRPEYDFAGLNAGNFVGVINYNKHIPDMAFWACRYFKYGGRWDVSACTPIPANYCGSFFGKPRPDQPCEPVPFPKYVAGPNPGSDEPVQAATPATPK